MPVSDDISIRKSGKAGRITLTRPQALNALTYDMCMEIGTALGQWETDPTVSIVVIDAEGSKAFCAGGDIADLYETGKAGDFEFGRKFWADEYRVNARIKNYPKPYVAIMDGIVMGGGVGISAHGSHRIVTENTMFAMPECGIGLVPDVGGNLLLSRAPGHVGEYLATTGARLGAADCIYTGIGDLFISTDKRAILLSELEKNGDVSVLDQFASDAGESELASLQTRIDGAFSSGNAAEIASRLEGSNGEWESKTAKSIRRGCPLSVSCAIDLVRASRNLDTIEQILDLEYRFTYRSMSDGEFIEGVRAQIIDKDRNPKWQTPTLDDLSSSKASHMLSPLEEGLF